MCRDFMSKAFDGEYVRDLYIQLAHLRIVCNHAGDRYLRAITVFESEVPNE